jgi:hypothetical protein
MQLSGRPSLAAPLGDAAALSTLRRSPLPVSWIRCVKYGIFLHLVRAPTEFVTAHPGCAACRSGDPAAGAVNRPVALVPGFPWPLLRVVAARSAAPRVPYS